MNPSLLLIGSFLSSEGENPAVGEALASRLREDGWQVITTSHKRPRIARLIDMLTTVWARRRDYRLACVEVYSGPAFLWAEAVCRVLRAIRKPYILALHGGNLPSFARHQPKRVGRLLKSAEAVAAPSRYLMEEMGVYRDDILLIPNPLDLAQYPFRVREKPEPLLIWLRAFHSLYNPRMAVRAVAALCKDIPEASLVMIGPDKGDGSLQTIRELAARLGVIDRIRFIPGIPKREVPEWLAQADLFINTTNTDNTPVSVMEAMACGLCVISTNVGGIPYLLEDGKDALLVSADDDAGMAKAVRRILGESGLAARLSQSGRLKAGEFDWPVILPHWKDMFEMALSRRGRGN